MGFFQRPHDLMRGFSCEKKKFFFILRKIILLKKKNTGCVIKKN